MSQKNIFQKIIDHEIPSKRLYEDEHCIVIRDIAPQAPTHLLIIPKKPIARISSAVKDDGALLGHLLLTAKRMARTLGLRYGFRLAINNGSKAGQTVPHLHVHLLAGRRFTWPPG